MRKICSLSLIFFSFFNSAFAQLLMNESFDAFATGSLSGKGAWVNINGSTLVINVASASPITGCTGGSGNYVQPGTASALTTERLSYPTTNFLASTSQVFYLSFLLNLSSAGSDVNAHIISIGNDFGGTSYEFTRFHVQQSGAGFNIGISEGNGTGLGGNSGGGINWGTTVLNLNQTYHIVLRYDYANGGGANADVIRAWVNPGITAGSEPVIAAAETVIAAGTRGNDILFDGDNIRNVYLNYKNTNSPVYKIDVIKYARGATSAASWSNLSISGNCAALPLNWLAAEARLNYQLQPLITWKVDELNVHYYIIERSLNGVDFASEGTIASKGNGIHEYFYTDDNNVGGTAFYRIKQVDIDGNYTFSTVLFFRNLAGDALRLYPNPAKQMASLQIADPRLMYTTAHLYDINGRVLKQIMLTQMTTSINMQPYPAGNYFVKLQNGNCIGLVKE